MFDTIPNSNSAELIAPGGPIRVLMITSEFPTPERPAAVPFIVRQIEHISRKGVKVDVFAFSGQKKMANYVKAWRDLRRHLQGKEFDLVHAQWGHSAVLALPKRMPWVITFRGNDLEGIVGNNGRYTLKGRVLTAVARLMSRLADERIVVSEGLGGKLNGSSYSVIPSGLDLELFRPLPKDQSRELLGLPKHKKLVLFAASTIENPRKRFALAKQAVEMLKNKHTAEIVVANKVDHSMIPVYMSACDALLLTSMHEGSPNVVKEALACNLPVVSVDVGDVRQRLRHVRGCEICGDAKPETIAAALDRTLSRGARTSGRSSVLELDEANIADLVIGVYRRALLKSFVKSKSLKTEVMKSGRVSEQKFG